MPNDPIFASLILFLLLCLSCILFPKRAGDEEEQVEVVIEQPRSLGGSIYSIGKVTYVNAHIARRITIWDPMRGELIDVILLIGRSRVALLNESYEFVVLGKDGRSVPIVSIVRRL